MSGSGSSTPTKPVPTPRGGSKLKERSASDKYIVEFQNTVRQFYEWMDKIRKCVFYAYQKRRNVTKVGRPIEKRTFRCPRGRRIFLHESLLSGGTKVRNWAAILSQIREKLNTPTDDEQLFRLKRMGNPLILIHFFVIWLCKSLSVRI